MTGVYNKNMDLLIKKFAGKWVALKPNTEKVVASGGNAKAVYKKAQKMGVAVPTLFKVPVKYVPYIG